jgi:hypothetical protein
MTHFSFFTNTMFITNALHTFIFYNLLDINDHIQLHANHALHSTGADRLVTGWLWAGAQPLHQLDALLQPWLLQLCF